MFRGKRIRGEWPKNHRPQCPGDRQDLPFIGPRGQDQALSPLDEDPSLGLGAWLGTRLRVTPHFPTLLGSHFHALFFFNF